MLQSQPNPHSDLPASGISTEIQTAPGDSVPAEPAERPLPFGVYRGDLKPLADIPPATAVPGSGERV